MGRQKAHFGHKFGTTVILTNNLSPTDTHKLQDKMCHPITPTIIGDFEHPHFCSPGKAPGCLVVIHDARPVDDKWNISLRYVSDGIIAAMQYSPAGEF